MSGIMNNEMIILMALKKATNTTVQWTVKYIFLSIADHEDE